MPNFRNMEELKEANKKAGRVFFDPSHLKHSRTETDLIGDMFVITSTQPNEDSPRVYTVHICSDEGHIGLPWAARKHDSLDEALRWIKETEERVIRRIVTGSRFRLEELRDCQTIYSYHFANLKIDTPTVKVYLTRDEKPEVIIEWLFGNEWKEIMQYRVVGARG